MQNNVDAACQPMLVDYLNGGQTPQSKKHLKMIYETLGKYPTRLLTTKDTIIYGIKLYPKEQYWGEHP